ncbi:GAF domain-containing protein [Mycena sanguinolenta]|uniref:GAF domain-containing protein n=1 Tax=Mycena sanguinolenta TaxID=230812 RepID=A0A8H7DLC6_9AGAR|nr:GAF domain-containing protein [Mycena sanguinolenta]
MPHADSALVPETITTKAEFWAHTYSQLDALLDSDQRNWVTNLSNASSLIYNSLLAFPAHFGNGQRGVNWCGFYLDSPLFPLSSKSKPVSSRLLLGPFNGKPACQYINTAPGKARGVCADSFLQRRTVVVTDVESYPGHIACDGETRSEIVCPLILSSDGDNTSRVLGVLDLDCLAVEAFDDEDKAGLEKIADQLVKACDW